MHPPLERPHPKCQDAIHALNLCHAQKNSKIFFWRCNEVKYELDRCFKQEKQEMLANLNAQEGGIDHIREQEDSLFERGQTFQEYLKNDPEYKSLQKKS